MTSEIKRLHYKLEADGVRLHGVAKIPDGYRIDYTDQADQTDRTKAAAILATFDPDQPTTPEEKDRDDLRDMAAVFDQSNAELSAWLATQKTQDVLLVILRCLRWLLRSRGVI